MAERRMYSRELVNEDSFLSLSHRARALYILFLANADDDGVLAQPLAACRLAGCTQDDLQELSDAGFVFKNRHNLYLITHWLQNNQIRLDRYQPSRKWNLLEDVYVTVGKEYTLSPEPGAVLLRDYIREKGGSKLKPEYGQNKKAATENPITRNHPVAGDSKSGAIDKISKDKISKDKGRGGEKRKEQSTDGVRSAPSQSEESEPAKSAPPRPLTSYVSSYNEYGYAKDPSEGDIELERIVKQYTRGEFYE